jgi:hypothetical protein
VGNGTTDKQLSSGKSLTVGTWAQVVLTYDGTTQSIYINGAFASSATTVSGPIIYSPLPGTANGFDIGNTTNLSAARYFPGLIDDVRVYNRALSPAEIQALYNAEK